MLAHRDTVLCDDAVVDIEVQAKKVRQVVGYHRLMVACG